MVRDEGNQGFTVKQKIVIAIACCIIFFILGAVILYLTAVKAYDEGWFGLEGGVDKFAKPENRTSKTNPKIIKATGFTPIKLDQVPTMLTGKGEFSGSFTNDQEYNIKIKSAKIIDKKTGKSCTLQSTKGDKIPADGYFTLTGVNCVDGYPSDPYEVRIVIDYEVEIIDEKVDRTMTGNLRGYFV
jgi:hypothetical protein